MGPSKKTRRKPKKKSKPLKLEAERISTGQLALAPMFTLQLPGDRTSCKSGNFSEPVFLCKMG